MSEVNWPVAFGDHQRCDAIRCSIAVTSDISRLLGAGSGLALTWKYALGSGLWLFADVYITNMAKCAIWNNKENGNY
jgi:hypothetical protein